MQLKRSALPIGALLTILGCASAHASLIYDFQSVTASGANFDWKYNARLSGDQQLGSGATDFAVVYDFLGVLSASTSNVLSGLTLTTTIENTTTPQPNFQNVPDSAAIKNVRTNIAGSFAATGSPAPDTIVYTIDIISTNGTRGNFAFQSGQALKNVPGDPTNGSVTGNTAMIEAPGPLTGTPEPATMALVGSAFLGLGLFRRKRKVA